MEDLELLTVDAFVRQCAADRPKRPAMVGERRIDFAELEASTRRVAAALQAAGLKRGDRIAWLGKNAVLYFTLLFGAARLGVVTAPVGWRLATPERRWIVDDTEAKLLFAGSGFADDARALATELPRVQRVFSADEAWAWIDVAQDAPFEPSGAEHPILQLYTSGTTGHPKGVELSNRNLFGLRRAGIETGLPWAAWDDDEVVMVAMPCAHIGGTGLGFMALAGGVCGCVMPEFTPDGVFDAIRDEGVTRFFAVPAALQMLVNHPRCAQTDFSRLPGAPTPNLQRRAGECTVQQQAHRHSPSSSNRRRCGIAGRRGGKLDASRGSAAAVPMVGCFPLDAGTRQRNLAHCPRVQCEHESHWAEHYEKHHPQRRRITDRSGPRPRAGGANHPQRAIPALAGSLRAVARAVGRVRRGDAGPARQDEGGAQAQPRGDE